MRLLRTVAVTFAQYSRIPMPVFEWKDEDMRCSMAVFPWVGAVIGFLYICAYGICISRDLPGIAAVLLMTAVPLILTGGFHVDGFMDTSDALCSFGTREHKLEILKDPHIGAFAVIRLAGLGLLYIAATAIIVSSYYEEELVIISALGFFLSRALSALAVLTFRSARNEGMLFYESTTAAPRRAVNLVFTVIWILLVLSLMVLISPPAALFAAAGAAVSFIWYRIMSYREFGGITGDTAGWFVTVCETLIEVLLAAFVIIAS